MTSYPEPGLRLALEESKGGAGPDSAGSGYRHAFRCRKLLETGVYGTVEEIAAADQINSSYVSRVMRLTLRAPPIVEAMTLAVLMQPFALMWNNQSSFDFSPGALTQTDPDALHVFVRVAPVPVFLTERQRYRRWFSRATPAKAPAGEDHPAPDTLWCTNR